MKFIYVGGQAFNIEMVQRFGLEVRESTYTAHFGVYLEFDHEETHDLKRWFKTEKEQLKYYGDLCRLTKAISCE